MYATDFEFNGELASNHGLMVCTWGDESDVAEGGNIEPNTFKPPNRDTFDWYGGQFNEPLVWNVSIANSMCPYVVTKNYQAGEHDVILDRNDLKNYKELRIDTSTLPADLIRINFMTWDINEMPSTVYQVAKNDLDNFVLSIQDLSRVQFWPYGQSEPFTVGCEFTTLPNMETEISIEREREIARWLMKPGYKWTRFLNDRDGSESLWYKCNVSVTPHQLFGSTIGFDLTFTSNCAYGFTDEQVITDVVSSSNSLTFNISTDINEYVYPIITLGGKGEIELYNENDLEQNLTNAKQTKVMVKSDVSNEIDEVIVGNISPSNIKKVKGTSININDATDNKLRTINIMGKSEQETTNGYQLCEKMYVGNTSSDGKISVKDKGIIHFEGVFHNQTDFYVHSDAGDHILPRGQYTVSFEHRHPNIRIMVSNYGTLTTSPTTINFTEDKTFNVVVRVLEGSGLNTDVKIQLESGTVAHDYEAYTSCKPSPSIDYPQAITDITQEGVEITDGTDTQSAELTKTLRGIPVTSGGNYTDNNNQQWICDTIERYKDGSGKYVQRVVKVTLDGSETWTDYSSPIVYTNIKSLISGTPNIIDSLAQAETTLFTLSNDVKTYATVVDANDNSYMLKSNRIYFSPTVNEVRLNATQFMEYLSNNNAVLECCLETPIETPLTSEELAELDLETYYPSTTITSNADVECEYVFFNEVYSGYIEEPTVFELNVSSLEDRDVQISQKIIANVNPEKLTHIGLRIIGINNDNIVTELYTGYDKYINLTLSDNIKSIVGQVMYWHSGISDTYTEQFDCKVQIYNKGSVILDADNDIITGITNPKTDFNYYFPHLVDGENTIKTTSDTDIDIEIKYREARRVIL